MAKYNTNRYIAYLARYYLVLTYVQNRTCGAQTETIHEGSWCFERNSIILSSIFLKWGYVVNCPHISLESVINIPGRLRFQGVFSTQKPLIRHQPIYLKKKFHPRRFYYSPTHLLYSSFAEFIMYYLMFLLVQHNKIIKYAIKLSKFKEN